jgi:nucleoside-diphosphate-sugar epimerase
VERERVLVIGGTGLLGRALVPALIDRGCEVRVMARRAPGPDGATFIQGDKRDPEALARAIDGAGVVYDLSLGGGPTWDEWRRDFVDGTVAIAEACLARRVRRLIYTSSIAALHLASFGSIDESVGPDPRPWARGWYPRGKILAEHALGELHDARGLPVVILRPGIVVGRGHPLAHPGIGTWRSPTCCEVIGPGTTPLPLVLIEDVVQALVLAREAPGVDGRIFNLVGDVRPSASDYVELAAARSRRRFRLVPRSIGSVQAIRLALSIGKLILRRKDDDWQSFHELVGAPQRTWLDCASAKQLLGWRPISDRDEFLRRAIDCHLPPPIAGDLRS